MTSSERGFGLIETTIAVGVLTMVAIGVAQLFAVAAVANLSARGGTSTAVLAAQKMEQLRGLTWGYDDAAAGLPVSDLTTNLATEPPGTDGRGLSPSPTGSLSRNTPGYVDFLDTTGAWTGTGAAPPSGTSFIRRWSIAPLPSNPSNTLVIQVRVVPLAREARRTGPDRSDRLQDETWLVNVKTRKAP